MLWSGSRCLVFGEETRLQEVGWTFCVCDRTALVLCKTELAAFGLAETLPLCATVTIPSYVTLRGTAIARIAAIFFALTP
jgi:hypothetical protein